jgi:ubiquinone/menaquinone biosynthesis C-methylase UbiE
MIRSARVNYDAIADLYDRQPYRTKSADPELLALISQRTKSHPLCVLDIGCGTGNQLVANRTVLPEAQLVGLDPSLGMLRQAQPKAPDICWVQADGAMLPFAAETFDFISCQHALHHVHDKVGMLQAAFRVLRSGGRLVVHSLCPQESADWLYYEYFPEARAIDLVDFWSTETLVEAMETNGFLPVRVDRRQIYYEQNLRDWFAIVRRRDTCSQLTAIPDAAYAAGLRRLEQELASNSAPPVRPDHLCLVTIRGEKPMGVLER